MFFSLLLLLPTQLGKHFWPDLSFVKGIPIDYLSPTLYLTDIIVISLFIVFLGKSIWTFFNRESVQKQKVSNLSLNGWVMYLLFLVFVSGLAFFSNRPLGSMYSILKFLELSFIVYYVAHIMHRQAIVLSAICVLCFGGIFESILAFAQFVNQGSIGGILYFFGERSFVSSTPGIANASLTGELLLRPYGTFPHPNVLAGFLLIVLLLALFLYRHAASIMQRYVSIAYLMIGTGALLLTLSRVAIVVWLLILIGLCLRIYLRTKLYIPNMYIRVIIIGLFISLCTFGLFASPLGARIFETSLTEEAVQQRTILIESAMSIFQSNPLFGVGLGNFLPALGIIQQPLSFGLYLQPVHNIFLLLLAEIGIVGFLFFAMFLLQTFRRLVDTYISNKSINSQTVVIISSLSAICLLGLFDHYWITIQQGQLLFAVILGIAWGVSSQEL